MIGDLDLSFYCIDLFEELADPDIHEIHDKLLDNDHSAKQYQHVTFKCHVALPLPGSASGSKQDIPGREVPLFLRISFFLYCLFGGISVCPLKSSIPRTDPGRDRYPKAGKRQITRVFIFTFIFLKLRVEDKS